MTSGRCRRGAEFQGSPPQNFYAPEHMCAPSEQLSYEAMPCCFYQEMKVHRAPGGRYAEDYAVNVHYAHTDSDTCSGQGCCELSQRIPIIPEDTDCELGLGVETRGSLLPASITEEVEMQTGERQDAGEGFFLSGQFRSHSHAQEEETRALFHSQCSTTHDASGNSTATDERLGV